MKLQPEFQIIELTSSGSISVKDASGKKSLGHGRWKQHGDKIEISVNGTSGTFKFHNGVAMSSDDGKHCSAISKGALLNLRSRKPIDQPV